MNGEEVKSKQKEYVLQSWSKQGALNPIPVEKAEGIYFYDYDGKRYADMSSQLVNLNLGFGNKDIADAIAFCFLHAGGLCIDKANQHQQKHDKHLLEYDGEHKPHLPKQFPAPKKELQPILLFLFYRK